MKSKILFDSCIIVSASVFVSSTDDLGIKLKHHFYDQAMHLFSLVRKNLAKRIGIVTATVENEALRVLSEVVRGEIRMKYHEMDRETLFKHYSIAFNACDMRMRNLLTCLQREPVEPAKVAIWFALVVDMYNDLVERIKKHGKTAALKARLVPRKLKKMADWFEIYRTGDQRTHAQLFNLLRKEVEQEDQMILAEACYLLNLYKQIESKDVSLFIASTDHHFSPVRRKSWTYESRQVTDAIRKRFGIICDWPDRVYEQVYKTL